MDFHQKMSAIVCGFVFVLLYEVIDNHSCHDAESNAAGDLILPD